MPKKIALVTPWPPQSSGIADYAYDLASQMKDVGSKVHVFTSEPNPIQLKGVCFHVIENLDDTFKELDVFDIILMQLGNHPHFHGYMLPILDRFKHKCTIELHDLMLHHLMQGQAGLVNGGDHYYSWLAANYGVEVSETFKNFFLNSGDILSCAMAIDFPCSDIVVKNSYRVIVHSHFAEERLMRRDVKNIFVVNHCLKVDSNASEIMVEHDCFRIGVFGGVQRNRRIDWIINSLNIISKNIPKWRLDIVGDVDQDCEYLYDLASACGTEHSVIFHGRVALLDLNKILEQCDIHIALRSPTMGETSGVVTRGLSLGIPTIVSNIAWYSELPDFVLKVDDDLAEEQLGVYLAKLANNRVLLRELRKKTASYAKINLNFNKIVDDILTVVYS
jgi:glycosyltransferase involved in cell wall biosynthesis